jgi:hypothetical protein
LNSSGSFADHARASPFRRPRLHAGRWRSSAGSLSPFSSSPPLLPPFFFFTNSGSVAPGWASWRLRPPVRLLHSSHLPQPGGGYSRFGERNPKGGRRRTGSRLGIFIGQLLGFASSREGGADAAQGARRGHPARQRCRGAAAMGVRCPAPTMPSRGRRREKGKRWGKERLTGGPHMAVKQEERWVVDGSADCVGPKGIGGLAV